MAHSAFRSRASFSIRSATPDHWPSISWNCSRARREHVGGRLLACVGDRRLRGLSLPERRVPLLFQGAVILFEFGGELLVSERLSLPEILHQGLELRVQAFHLFGRLFRPLLELFRGRGAFLVLQIQF